MDDKERYDRDREREREKDGGLVVSAKVFVADPPEFDASMFELWLSNMTPENVTRVRARESGDVVSQLPNYQQLLLDDTLDHYRTYNLLSHYLNCPMLFMESSSIPLPPPERAKMIGLYYDVDTTVARYVLGKKLDARRDYEDLVEATNLSAGYCRRHYENFRRVYRQASAVIKSKGGDSGDKSQTLTGVIQHDFMLSTDVAAKYAVIAFLCRYRFETLRKRLAVVPFAAFATIVGEMFHRWTLPNRFTIDLQFLAALRHVSDILKDAKVLAEYHGLMLQAVAAPSDLFLTKCPTLLKTLLKISGRLTAAKELRDLFVDVSEKVLEPHRTDRDLVPFLLTLITVYPRLRSSQALTTREGLASAWTSFLRVVISCVQSMTE
jgi:hypothetical protein